MNVKVLAAILLAERIVATFFIVAVLRIQLKLLRLKANDDAEYLRRLFFLLGAVIFVGQFVPIIIDVAALFFNFSKASGSPRPLGTAYALSNATTAIVSCLLLWLIYKLTADQNSNLRRKNTELTSQNKSLNKRHKKDAKALKKAG